MHILIIHQAFASLDQPGGTRHHEMARFFAAQGHRVTIIASPVSYITGKATTEKRAFIQHEQGGDGITILRAYTYSQIHRSFFHRILSFISFMFSSFIAAVTVKKVDAVWGTSPPIFQGFTAWLVAFLKKVPFIFEIRDLWPAFAVAMGVLKNPVLIRLSEWLETFLYKRAARLIVNSPGYIPHVLSRGAKSVELVPNSSDISMFDPAADGKSFRSEHHIPEDTFLVLYAGAHGLSNDLGIVLQTAALLQENPQIQLILLGDGKEKPHLVSQAQQMGLKNIVFLPPTPKNRMKYALAAADACLAILLPIEMYRLTYPNKIFDYMAAARPTLLAIDGVARDVIEAAKAGICIPPGNPVALKDAILFLASNRELCLKMGLSGRRYVEEHFNRQQVAQKLLMIMEEVR